MTARPVSPPVLLRYAQAALDDDHFLLVLRASPTWRLDNGGIEVDGHAVRVVPVESPLAAHAAVADHSDGELLVLLTERDDLGQELLARSWRGEPVTPTSVEACKRLFQVDGLHRRLADHRWLLDLLVDVAPRRGYPPPPGGVLDLQTAWRTALRHALGLEADRPSLPQILRWAQRDASRAAADRIGPDNLERIAAHLAHSAGPAVPFVIGLVRDGKGPDTVALGLVCGALWGDVHEGHDVVAARTRLEEREELQGITNQAAHEWSQAARQLVRDSRDAHEDAVAAAWVRRAEEVLLSIRATDLAAASDVLPTGFEQRLEAAGHRLAAVLDDPTEDKLDLLQSAVAAVDEHLEASRPEQRRRAQALGMALRLARRRVRHDESPPSDLLEAAQRYRSEGAYVDEARDRLDEGETVESLAQAYGTLMSELDDERAERDRDFASRLAAWTEIEPMAEKLLPIEALLDRVLEPITGQAPVLLLVVDGLSWDTAHRLLDDIASKGWSPHGPTAGPFPPVVATFPTVTRVSRSSLLAGRRTAGGQDVESDGFTGHQGLRHAAGGQAPHLFHKADLQVEVGHVSPELRDVVTDPDQRVVGVVVNAVDDHLDKGGQLNLAEGLEGIATLRWLLSDAAEAGRVVVLTSDHGHIHEHDTQVIRPRSGGGERWRPDSGDELTEDEVRLAGSRVLDSGGEIIAAASERIRYQPMKKNGYHGGATPAEVLCPLAVFAPANVTLEGYARTEAQFRPPWWSAEEAAARPVSPAIPVSKGPVEDADGLPQLFPADREAEHEEPPGWLERLLDSPVLDQQRQVAGRAVLDEKELAELLLVLDANGDVMTRPAMAQALGLPVGRVQGKVQALKAMLNVDMYDVIAVDSDGTVRLQRELLNTQFGLSS